MKKGAGLVVTLGLLVCLCGSAKAQTGHSDAFTFFIPYPADTLDDQFDAAHTLDFRGSSIVTTISISVLRDGSFIYYDHWEDGLEPNITLPTQASTQVWGPLSAGDVIAPQNVVPVEPRDPSLVLFDGGDKVVTVGGAIAVSVAVWPETVPDEYGNPQAGILFAGAWELYPTSRWGTDYVIPVGENVYRANGGFRTVGLNVQAVENDTLVDLDLNADGVFEITGYQLNEGQQVTQVQGVNAGATVRTSAPVQVHVFTGDAQQLPPSYEARAYTVLPRDQWSNEYLAPRSSGGDYWLYNPNATDLIVAAETNTGTTNITISPNDVAKYPPAGLSAATGVHFTATDDFYGVVALDESRVYVTALSATTITVDYENDGTPDNWYPVVPLAEVDITDPTDRDMTAARLYTENGVPFVAVWGQDESAPPALPSIDIGTSVVPLRAPSIQKLGTPIVEGYNCGTLKRPFIVTFQLLAYNDAVDDFLDVMIADTLSAGITYVPASTRLGGSPIPDDSDGSPFPLDGAGYNVGTIPGMGDLTITFDAVIEDPGVYVNQADIISPPADPASFALSLPYRVASYAVAKTLLDPSSGVVDYPGQVITFGLTITNTGNVAITQLPLRDAFDENYLTFHSASVPPDVVVPGETRWDDLTTFFGGDLLPTTSISLTVSLIASDPLPSGEPDTHNLVLAEEVVDAVGRTQAILCAEAMVIFPPPQEPPEETPTPTLTPSPPPSLPSPTPPPPSTTPPLSPTPPPPSTPSPPPPQLTPPVLFLPETGSSHATVPLWWLWIALPALALLVAWADRHHRR
jgi:uncharacterized repeat protein (TIGR01451 family)